MRVNKTINLFIGNLLFPLPTTNRLFPLPHGERVGVRGIGFSIKDNNGPDFVPQSLIYLLEGTGLKRRGANNYLKINMELFYFFL